MIDDCREMSVRFAEVERNLGEIDRARAIYSHCSEICDPRVCHSLLIPYPWMLLAGASAILGDLEGVRDEARE